MATGVRSTTLQRGASGQGRVSCTGPDHSNSPQDQAAIQSLLQKAGRAHQAGDLDKLQKILEEILEIDPGHANALYNLGILHRDRDNVFAAEVHLRRAIRADPDHIDSYQGLADLLFSVKHLLPAAQVYEDALKRAPNRLSLLLNLAKTRMMLKDTGESERLVRRVLSIDDRSSEAWSTLAWALLYRGGDPAEALQAAEEALRLAPEQPYPRAMREQALRRLGRTGEADDAWTAILADAAFDWEMTRPLNEAYYWLDQSSSARRLQAPLSRRTRTAPKG